MKRNGGKWFETICLRCEIYMRDDIIKAVIIAGAFGRRLLDATFEPGRTQDIVKGCLCLEEKA